MEYSFKKPGDIKISVQFRDSAGLGPLVSVDGPHNEQRIRMLQKLSRLGDAVVITHPHTSTIDVAWEKPLQSNARFIENLVECDVLMPGQAEEHQMMADLNIKPDGSAPPQLG